MAGEQSLPHVSFVLLAEFDKDVGSIMAKQYPFPIGTDDQLLAELMLPDGAHSHAEDWTFFFLNQSSANTIAPVISDDQTLDESNPESNDQPLLYVLNLVRTKKDPTAPRGGWVKALAICTRHPFINIFRHALMKTLDEYFASPSVDVLAGLYDAINAMDLSNMPVLTRPEKLILRSTDRRDLFAEKFITTTSPRNGTTTGTGSDAEHASFISGSTMINQDENGSVPPANRAKFDLVERPGSPYVRRHSLTRSDRSGSVSSGRSSPVNGESSGWKSHDDEDDTAGPAARSTVDTDNEDGFTFVDPSGSTPRPLSRVGVANGSAPKVASDQRSLSSKTTQSTRHQRHGSTNTMDPSPSSDPDSHQAQARWELDTHYYPSSIVWKKYDDTSAETVLAKIDVNIPMSNFSGEVGDYSLSRLVNLFCKPTASISGPLHPHLHTNGALTHPLILLFNALVTQKRIIFLGHGRPANSVARYVLAACAFGSGCGSVLRGFTHRAFPYTNLSNHSVMTSVSGFIAGVINPIYRDNPGWDILCDIDTGKITVNKDIQSPAANASFFPQPPGMVPRQGSAAAIGSDEDLRLPIPNGAPTGKPGENYDNAFVEELHGLSEPLVRARVTEFVQRFVQLAARHEEDTVGHTNIAYPSASCSDGQLGSGTIIEDPRELSSCIGRIEGWRKSMSYDLFKTDFLSQRELSTFRGIDLGYQITRLRSGRYIPDAEVQMIIQILSHSVRTYEQVIELLSYMPLNTGGLMPLSFGLFHPIPAVRDQTVDLLTTIRSFKIGVHCLRQLNYFHRMAYVRLAMAREAPSMQSPISNNNLNGSRLGPPPSAISRTPSNLSSVSVGAG